jgi:hypothetical protein
VTREQRRQRDAARRARRAKAKARDGARIRARINGANGRGRLAYLSHAEQLAAAPRRWRFVRQRVPRIPPRQVLRAMQRRATETGRLAVTVAAGARLGVRPRC